MKEEDPLAFKEEQLLRTSPVEVLPWGYTEMGVPSVNTAAPTLWWDG